MATSLSEMRKNRASMMANVIKSMEKKGFDKKEADTRFWTLTRDKSDVGSAIIRVLPPVHGNELPYVNNFTYGFQGSNGKWYINNSLWSIGQVDPVGEANGLCYASKEADQIEIAKKRKLRKQFIANIFVVKDPANPENDGKVFLWKFGSKILDTIKGKLSPEFDGDEPQMVWDIDTGSNFRLRAKRVADFVNFDSSEWASPSPLAKTDEEMEAIINQAYDLSEFTKPEFFKTYDQLMTEFKRVSEGGSSPKTAEQQQQQQFEDVPDLDAMVKNAAQPAKKVAKKVEPTDDDDSMDEFEKLLKDM